MTPPPTEPPATRSEPALALRDVELRIDDHQILSGITWEVDPAERWVILGPNGSGKTSLLRIASLALHPSTGEVVVLGERLGRVDVRTHRQRIGFTGSAVARSLRPGIRTLDVVVTALRGALEPWWHEYEPFEYDSARELLDRFGVGEVAEQPFGTLSSGEQQRTLIARALITEPGLLLLDEPTSGLDLGGREELLDLLRGLARDELTPPTLLVTHHVEEIPPGFTHGLLLRDGRISAAGPLDKTLSDEALSECFGLPVEVTRHGDRWSARAH